MNAKDCWESLARAAPEARVVLRLEDGREIDVTSMTHYAGLVVIAPAEPVEDGSRAEALEVERDEAREKLDDFLQELKEARRDWLHKGG